MITTQTIELSMTPEITVLPEVYCSQYDNGIRKVVFNLFTDAEKTTPYNVDGLTAIVEGTKPDGNAYAIDAQASGSSVTVTITTQMAAVAGIVPSEIVLTDGNVRVGSLNFLLMVEPAGINDDAVVSDSEIPPYVNSAKASADAAAASQSAATASEAAAATASEAAAASQAAAAASQAAAAASQAAAAASEAAAATSETNAADSAEASEYWAQQSMEGKMLATLPDVDLPDPIPDGSLLRYDATSGKWSRISTPLRAPYGGTGNATGYVQRGAKDGFSIADGATAEGYENKVGGAFGHAEGVDNYVGGYAGHAEGRNNYAYGECNHVEGRGARAQAPQNETPAVAVHVGGLNVLGSNINGQFVRGASNENKIENRFIYSKFNGDVPASKVSGFVLGYSPHWGGGRDFAKQPHLSENKTIDGTKGCSATIGGVTTVTITLEPAGIYLLLCNAFTLATGAIYGATARMISCLPTTDGTPNILSLGQTTAAPATIAAAANHTITIQNAAATRATQFTLIRVA